MAVTVTDSYLTEKSLDYAKLSDLAYAEWDNATMALKDPQENRQHFLGIWNELSAANKGYTFIKQYTDPYTGYSGVIFQDSTGKKILANRGTESSVLPSKTDPDDIAACTEILANETPGEQFKSMVNFISANDLASSQFNVTGHSLGGCLAQMAKAAFGGSIDEAYTYNAPGAKNLTKSYSYLRILYLLTML